MKFHIPIAPVIFCFLLPFPADAEDTWTIEASAHPAPGAEVFRDNRSDQGKCAGRILAERPGNIVDSALDLPAGNYSATFWLSVSPVEVLHHLAVTVKASSRSVTFRQIQFDGRDGYQPFEIRFFHPGGTAAFQVIAQGGSGFDGMRKSLSDEEQADMPDLPEMSLEPGGDQEGHSASDMESALDLLESERNVTALTAFEHHVLCDRIQIEPLAQSEVFISHLEIDKIHYRPGETVSATATLRGAPLDTPGKMEFVAEEISEIDNRREVYRRAIDSVSPDEQIFFQYPVGDPEFGRELRCSLVAEETGTRHDRSVFYGVSRNVYRIGITGNGGPQDTQSLTRRRADSIMAANKAAYANYFERFAWAPCDYSNLAPEEEMFFSGQTQYPGSIPGMRSLIDAGHAVGIKAITYGKACAAGIEGFRTFQKHPEFFGHRPQGPATEAFNTFYLERMVANDYLPRTKPSEGGWSHWASIWTRFTHDPTVEFGAQAVIDSIEMFGWDGIRWDGHFVGNQPIFVDKLRKAYPEFVHGYNIAFANPAGEHFLPRGDKTGRKDFHYVARDHGLMMDESARDWSHTNFSPGYIRAFYEALSREADYIKRIGGLPLYITFDMASNQDTTFNVLCGLSAGQRYTYLTNPGDFRFGPLTRFLTRYSALVWDDTALVAEPDNYISVIQTDSAEKPDPWWRKGVWLRERGEGEYQLLINLLNPPRYKQFCHRVQTPPATHENLRITLSLPEDVTFIRAVHASPDLSYGHELLEARERTGQIGITLSRLRTWSIVAIDIKTSGKRPFALTTPVEDASAILAEQDEEQRASQAAEENKRRAKAGIDADAPLPEPQLPPFQQYDKEFNSDAAFAEELDIPSDFSILRNGRYDVHHAKGAFAWLNPVQAATGLLKGGRYDPSWVDYVGFKRSSRGCMDEFPDTFDALRQFDILVLDNLHRAHLGDKRRVMIREFVKAGGGLLVFGGYFNLSMGADHNTALADLLPVRIRQYDALRRSETGMTLLLEDPEFFSELEDGAHSASCFSIDTSPLKEGAEVLVSAGGNPAIVGRGFGKGRVVTVLMNPHGVVPDSATPYWQWSQWPKVITACLRWLGQGAETTLVQEAAARRVDSQHPTPEALFMESFQLSSAEFTRRLQAARVNMIDAESSRLLLETAIDNMNKIEDMAVLQDIIERAGPDIDQSFSKLAERLVASNHDFLRQAGYQIIGIAGEPSQTPLLLRALNEKNRDLEREGLIALGRLQSPDSIPAIRRYLNQNRSESLLASSVLLGMDARMDITKAMKAFEDGIRRTFRLKSGKRYAHETLYGGVSFKLTREARRKHMLEYKQVIKLEKEAIHDVRHFTDTLLNLDEQHWDAVVNFYVHTDNPEMLPSAYAFFNQLPADKAKEYRARLVEANLPFLRLLAE